MSSLLGLTGRPAHGRLSEPARLRLSATTYVGAIAAWVMAVPVAADATTFDRRFYAQVLAFAVPFAIAAIPAHRWLSGRPAAARTPVLGALAGLTLLTVLLPFMPFGLKLAAFAMQGAFAAVGAAMALVVLRAGSGPDHGGRILGTAGGLAVLMIMGERALGARPTDFPGTVIEVLPLLLAAAAVGWLPVITPGRAPTAPPKPDIRWTVAAGLMGCAVALTASAAFNSGGGTWSDLFCIAGFILSGVLLDTERLTIGIGAAATAAVLAALSSQPSAGAISGLAQGLVQPLPWYIVMARLGHDSWMIVLACGQAIVWVCWNLWDTTRQADAALMAAMVSLLALSIVGTFVPQRNQLQARTDPLALTPEPVPSGPDEEPAPPEPLPQPTVVDALKQVYGSVLSPRELQVGQLVVLGVASREIAAQLYLSESTVKTHLKSLYRKTETANRNDLYRRLIAVANEEVVEQAVSNRLAAALTAAPRDPVTDLLARQAFERIATERIAIDQASRQPTALIYISLAMDPKAAEKQGPLLAVVAGILQSSLRTADLMFRYGETEFVAILPGGDGPGAHQAGERLAHRVRAWAASRPSAPPLAVGWASTADGAKALNALVAEAAGRMTSKSL